MPDEMDADLTWLGARWSGINPMGTGGYWGYRVDSAWVRGSERSAEIDDSDSGVGEVSAVRERRVHDWAMDVGLIGILPYRFEPRIFAGYAYGCGDRDPDGRDDDAFRQNGLQSNEAGFGGVERYPSYGLLLDPEPSKLQIATVGAGVSLWRSSSLYLVYHHYRLAQPADSLRDAGLDVELDGNHRALVRSSTWCSRSRNGAPAGAADHRLGFSRRQGVGSGRGRVKHRRLPRAPVVVLRP